jgi:hypothetical protein
MIEVIAHGNDAQITLPFKRSGVYDLIHPFDEFGVGFGLVGEIGDFREG